MAYPPDSKVHFINSKKRSSAIHLAMNELHVRSVDGTCCEVAVEQEVEEVLARFANVLASARASPSCPSSLILPSIRILQASECLC